MKNNQTTTKDCSFCQSPYNAVAFETGESVQCNYENGQPVMLFSDDGIAGNCFTMPIKYCPMCGRKLND
ncbi:hypothetical protein [Lactobacillus sp. 3B(2020)]|uniref:hypothetical protein n=1 Tax=Lactobacillus sp. 3B(2020) TaxID=2695882 RepID=UPI0015DF80E9|nr:hypothetical protein [Lactobacillus sp. 3B(2020)]QLL69777.1 hypothetical protein GTO83_04095 [Lactobacillus sp. 3B(2020)]